MRLWHDARMTTTPTHEFIAAVEAYTKTLHTWRDVHLAWAKGDASIDEDRAADEARKAALKEVQRLQALIKPTEATIEPTYGNKKDYQDQEAEAYDPYDIEAAADDRG